MSVYDGPTGRSYRWDRGLCKLSLNLYRLFLVVSIVGSFSAAESVS